MIGFRALAGLMLLALWPLLAAAEPALREAFEGEEPSWRDAGGDGNYKIASQERVSTGAHRGRGCEQLRINGDNGSYVYLSHEMGEARIINELAASVWLQADRPGLQILVRAVLPNSIDPVSGKPLTTLLRGSGYTQAGNWQQLRIDNLPRLLERQVRVLRAQHGPQVDDREAYVDRVLLNVYGGPGMTTVSIDDLEVTGIVGRPTFEPFAAPSSRSRLPDSAAERLPSTSATAPPNAVGAGARLSGTGLVVGERPFFPRLIEYRGEPLERLKALGFNGVRLTTAPTAELLREAASTNMWLVAPPPPTPELESRLASGLAGRLDNQFDPVLAWDLGQDLSARELEATKRWSRLVRSADPRRRPMICDADSDLLAYSRTVDLLMTRRAPLGTTADINQYATWLRQRPQLARPGTPTWTVIQTQPSERLLEQVAWLSGNSHTGLAWQDEQIRLLTFAALASGVRGICFQSQSPLIAADPATRRRAALMELLNLELELIEPWCASGNFVTTASGTDPETAAAVMQTDRARLVLPLAAAPLSQYALRLPGGGVARYVVPGVPESNDAYELTPGSLRPLAHKRVAGGISVVLPDGEQGSLVVLTQDPVVISNLTRRVARASRRAAELKLELASLHLARVDDAAPRLAAKGHTTPQVRGLVEGARASLKQAETRFAKGGYDDVFVQARRTEQLLYQVERTCWEKTVPALVATSSVPLAASYEMLPEYWQFVGENSAGGRSTNLLPAGEFEDLQFMMSSGWRHYQHPLGSVTTDVQLSGDKVHGGKLALRLQVNPATPDKPPTLVETAPLWVTTPPLQVESGCVICVHGWVNLPKAPIGSEDGLLIVDSLGGEPLAERIGQTNGWREIMLFRAVPRTQSLAVTFALTGLGEAWLDDFSVLLVPRRASAVEQAQQPTTKAQTVLGRR